MMDQTKEALKLIRADLKRVFPDTKFSVTTNRIGTVRVKWNESQNASCSEVENLLDKYDAYQSGYEPKRKVFIEGIPTVPVIFLLC